MNRYPLIFAPVLKEKVWGGRALETKLAKSLPYPEKPYGESWEVSAHPNGSSLICNGFFKGQSLSDVLPQYGEELIGKEIWAKYKGKFPLLLKFLDINDKLSIQVHPSDEYALRHENSFGKAECWYILEASADAKLIMGMKSGITKDTFIQQAEANNFDNLFEEVPVHVGDLVTIAPGTVHASLSGSILLFELQQNSDITYRIYDFDRLENGVARPLHIQKSAEVIDFSASADIKTIPSEGDLTLLDWQYFSLKRFQVMGSKRIQAHSCMRFYTLLSGSLTLDTDDVLDKGQSCLVPAQCEVTFKGEGILLESQPK